MDDDIRIPDPDYTSTLAARIMAAQDQTLPFKLVHSGGDIARVTRPSLTHLLAAGRVPQVFQDIVNTQIRKFGDGKQKATTEAEIERQIEGMLQKHGISLLTMTTKMYQETAIAGFRSPRLVADPNDRNVAENILWVGDIDSKDIEAYFAWCNKEQAADVDAAKSDDGEESAPAPTRITRLSEDVRNGSDEDFSGMGLPARSDQI